LITIVGIQIAQAHGGGDTERATQAIRTGWTLALIAGLIGTAAMLALILTLRPLGQPPEVLAILAPYWVPIALSLVPFTLLFTLKSLFESTDRAWLAAGFAYLGVAANIPLNLILIYGAFGWEGLGLMGGGIATLVSQILAYAAAHLYWAFAPSMRVYRGPSPVRLSVLSAQFKGGLPVAIGYVGEGGAFAVVGIIIGLFGATALASTQIVVAVAGIAYMLPLGMATAVSIRVGQAIGRAEPVRLRAIGLAGCGIVALWMLGVTAALILGGLPLARLLSDDPLVIALAGPLFLTIALMQVFDGVQATALGALRGMMDTAIPTAITLVIYWLLALPLAYVAGHVWGYGPVGVWAGYGVGLAIAAVILPLRFWRKTNPA
jgi:MATE family multidrug resistance protein